MCKMDPLITVVLLIGAVLLVLFLLFRTKPYNPQISHYIHPAMDGRPEAPVYYYQNMPPSLRVENQYHECAINECGGVYNDYECLQKCYIKTMKDGTNDILDRVCEQYKDDEGKYYSCLDANYANYIWMDRETGIGSCLCPDGSVGPFMSDGVTCSCIPKIPLSDRRMRDAEGRPASIPWDSNW